MATKGSDLIRLLSVMAVAGALLLAGCSSTGEAGAGMMGGGAHPAAGMMSGGPGYHYSRLTCSPPAALPGSTVRVVLADMGMTRMMWGDAPMGARMMLHAGPAAVPAGTVTLVARNVGWRTHELVFLPLAGQSSAGARASGPDGKVDEAGSLGEASRSCAAGQGEGIASASGPQALWLRVREVACPKSW